MQDNNPPIVLYSKYSTQCQEFANLISSSPVNLPTKFVCVDNKDIRKQVCSAKKIKITYLPCMLNVYADGTVEQYEGQQAFEAVRTIIRMAAPLPPANVIHTQPPVQPIRRPQPKREASFEEERVRHPRVRKPPTRRPDPEEEPEPQSEEPQGEPPKPSQSGGATAIGDLSSDDESEEEAEPVSIRKPRRRVRTDEGNYEEEEGEDYEPPSHNIQGQRQIRKSSDRNVKTGQSDVAARARELEKMREDSDKMFKKRGPGIPAEMRTN
jgi:hypothetical protein